MSEPKSSPSLTVVEGGTEEPAAAAQPGPPSRLRALVPWLLLAAAIAFCWMWLAETERAQGLEVRVTTLTGELADARADLAAWERHMGAVRGEVDRVAQALGSLQALVDVRPGEAAALEPGAAPARDAAAGPAATPLGVDEATD